MTRGERGGSEVYEYCVYTRARLDDLEQASRSEEPLELVQGKPWTTVSQWRDQARESSQSVLVLLSGADAYNTVAYVGVLDELDVEKRQTTCRLTHVRKLADAFGLSTLRRASDDGPLNDLDRHTYRHCRTPAFLRSDPPDRGGPRFLPRDRSRAAFLLLWNPTRYAWDDLDDEIARCASGTSPWRDWLCSSTQPRPADRVFLMRTGVEPRGIFAAGTVLNIPYFGDHFEEGKNGAVRYVSFRIDQIRHPEREDCLPLDALSYGPFSELRWPPRASGQRIPEAAATELEALWQDLISEHSDARALDVAALEGARTMALRAHYQRETRLRKAKIRAVLAAGRRLACEVPGCGFDFAAVYGENGDGYCHVHHKQQLATRGRATVTQLSDLAIVCANCHAMVHRNGECRALETLISARRS